MVAGPPAPRARRRKPRRRSPCSRAGPGAGARESRLRQSGRARRRPHRGNRHHRRTRFRLRAFQAARFPARQGSGADVRRRPVAGQYALGAEDAGRRMHQGDFLPDRQARDLLSRNPEAGGRRRTHGRIAHLVARQPQQQEADRAAAQGRDRKGFQRGEMGARRRARAVLPLPGAAASARDGHLSRRAQHRDLLLRSRLLRLQGEQGPDHHRQRDEEGRQDWARASS